MHSRTLLTLAGVLLAVQGCSAEATTMREAQVSPPPGRSVVLDTSVPGWQTSAWLVDGAFCVRAARTELAEGKENELVFCDPAPSGLSTAGSPLLPAKPQPYVAPLDPQSEKVILVRTARGDVARVSVTMFSVTATASVHPLPVTGDRQVGAYAVWLPRSGPERDGMTLSDITAVVGHDASGNVVARIG